MMTEKYQLTILNYIYIYVSQRANHIDNLFLNKKFTKVGSKSFYLKTPYENFEKDINEIVLEIKRQKKGNKSNYVLRPDFIKSLKLID